MNSLLSRLLTAATESDWPIALLIRISLLLAVVWLGHAALARANPRWRVLLWRGSAMAMLVLVALALVGPAIQLAVLPPIATTAARDNYAPALSVNPPPAIAAPQVMHASGAGAMPNTPLIEEQPLAAENSINTSRLVATEAKIAPALSSWSMAKTLSLIWAFGLLVGLAREAIAAVRIGRLRRRAKGTDQAIHAQADAISERLGLRKPFAILITRDLETPCVVGPWRPAILLPAGCGSDDLPAVLAHEIQHIKGADLSWNALLRLLARLLWFHPLAWRMRVAHVSACDAVCDAVAANYTGDVSAYCRTLARLALRAGTPASAVGLAMAGTSSTRRRIESLGRGARAARLSRRAICLAFLVGLIGAGLLGTTSLTRAAADSKKQDARPTISGTVRDAEGRPVAGATVQIATAGVRVGTSPFCPSCYADCGKNSKTDEHGRFSIESLDPTLVFNLLVIAEGYQPLELRKVDPTSNQPVEAALKPRSLPDDPACIVRGVVIGPDGKPAAGALIEPFGCKTGEKRWWSSLPGLGAGVDPMALTDSLGSFVIFAAKPVEGLDLQINAKGTARAKFELIPSGERENRLTMHEGVTVAGRVVEDGKGVAGVSVGLMQADRTTRTFVGDHTVITDEQGRFSLSHLSAGEMLAVYGLIDSLRDLGAVVSQQFDSPQAGAIDLGDLRVVPAHRLAGRIVLSDGKPVPEHTRVMIHRQEAWDSTFVEADADGSFAVTAIPSEFIAVFLNVPGYRFSAKNKSFDPLNGNGLRGVVAGDIEDLIILLEPGELERPDWRDNAVVQRASEKFDRLKTQPLAGVKADLTGPADDSPPVASPAANGENKLADTNPLRPLPKIDLPPARPAAPPADAKPARTVVGKVVDADGNPVAGARIWLPTPAGGWQILCATARADDEGRFRLNVPEAWISSDVMLQWPTVWAFAPGRAIGTASARDQLFHGKPDEPCTIVLPAESDVFCIVRTPNGEPAVGAKVMPQHLKTTRAYETIPQELADELTATATADAEGRVRLPALPEAELSYVVVTLDGFGRQQFDPTIHTTDSPEPPPLELRDAGSIEGRIIADQPGLWRGMQVEIETTSRFTGLGPAPDGMAKATIDEAGRFTIPEIADGEVRVYVSLDERLPVRPRLPEGLMLQAGQELQLDIPLEMAVKVRGLIRAQDTGQPIVGANVSVQYGAPRQWERAITDEKGIFRAFALPGKLAAHILYLPGDYVQLGEPWLKSFTVPEGVDQFELPTIDVVPSRTVSGTLVDHDGKPMANMKINGDVGNRRYGFGKTDAQGAFELDDIPVGVELDRFEIWTLDGKHHLEGEVKSKDPLVVQVKP